MKIVISLIVALFPLVGFAGVTVNQEYQLNTQMGAAAQATQLGTLLQKTQSMAVGKYSFAKQGGSTTAYISLLTNLNEPKSYLKIPYKAVITHVFTETLTMPQSSLPGLATQPNISVGLLTTADLLVSKGASTTFLPGFMAGVPLPGTTTTYIKVSTLSGNSLGYIPKVKITAGGASGTSSDLTQGKFNVYIVYSLGD